MSIKYTQVVKGKIEPLKNNVLISEIDELTEKKINGIIILNSEGKDSGIRPRWGKVYAVGDKIDYLSPNQWVLISHGRWTRGIKVVNPKTNEEHIVRMVDPKDLLLVSDEKPI